MIIIQKTFSEPKATLYLVSTPIGNMSDFSFRALEILKKVDYILTENIRIAQKILNFYKFQQNLISFNKDNEKKRLQKILFLLKSGKNLALISNAGTPLINDPGLLLVKTVKKEGFYITAIPGASAFLTALSLSAFDMPFLFLGFLPKKANMKQNLLLKYRFFSETLIFYESPQRIEDTLLMIQKCYQKRNVSLARELTKKFETIINGDINQILKLDLSSKGEYVLVVEGYKEPLPLEDLNLEEIIMFFLEQGLTQKEAFKKVAQIKKISKKEIYRKYKVLKQD